MYLSPHKITYSATSNSGWPAPTSTCSSLAYRENILQKQNGVQLKTLAHACTNASAHLPLLDAVLLGDGARVELPDRLVLEQVAAADLAVSLIGTAVTRLQADDVREAPARALGLG